MQPARSRGARASACNLSDTVPAAHWVGQASASVVNAGALRFRGGARAGAWRRCWGACCGGRSCHYFVPCGSSSTGTLLGFAARMGSWAAFHVATCIRKRAVPRPRPRRRRAGLLPPPRAAPRSLYCLICSHLRVWEARVTRWAGMDTRCQQDRRLEGCCAAQTHLRNLHATT